MPEICTVCGGPANRSAVGTAEVFRIDCSSCGVIQITGEAERLITKDRRLVGAVGGLLRERKLLGATDMVEVGTETVAALATQAPKTVSEKLDRTLLNLARVADSPGKKYRLSVRADAPIAFASDEGELLYILRGLHSLGYFAGDINDLVLSPKGWSRVEDLTRGESVGESCFVAMSFAESMDSVYELGIRPAIEENGWTPYHVGKLEHADRIDDVILIGIKRARFVVADFTHQRPSVYFEAGYAQGLGKLVIWTCRKDDWDNTHFDTEHYNHIVWTDEDDLRKRLSNRIRLLVTRRPRSMS